MNILRKGTTIFWPAKQFVKMAFYALESRKIGKIYALESRKIGKIYALESRKIGKIYALESRKFSDFKLWKAENTKWMFGLLY